MRKYKGVTYETTELALQAFRNDLPPQFPEHIKDAIVNRVREELEKIEDEQME